MPNKRFNGHVRLKIGMDGVHVSTVVRDAQMLLDEFKKGLAVLLVRLGVDVIQADLKRWASVRSANAGKQVPR